jgi:ABC-2 type transport system permease protein
LPALRADLEGLLRELQSDSGGLFDWEIEDPGQDGELADRIAEQFGFQPLVIGLLDPQPFYFYLVLEHGEQAVPVPLPETLDRAGLKRAIEAGVRRFAPGVLRTVALFAPEPAPAGLMGQFGVEGGGPGYTLLKEGLREGLSLRETDLASGQVPEDADLLMVVAPEDLDEKQQFAIDQFLMQGGTVIVTASRFHVDLGGAAISARPQTTGLEDWLEQLGLTLEPSLVLDPQNTPFPIPVQRSLGGFMVEEIQTLDYPYFPDVRADGLGEASGITADLGQVTMNWSSPITVDTEANADREVTGLIESSAGSWTSDSPEVQPDFAAYPDLGFARGDDRGRKLLAVAIEGRFESAFRGQPSPLLPGAAAGSEADADDAADPAAAGGEVGSASEGPTRAEGDAPASDADATVVSAVVERSPSSARLILIGSSTFLSDTAISLATEATRTRYLKPLELIQNAVEWSLEDRGLLALRGRGQFGRLLEPVGRQQRMLIEYLNYALALGGLVLVYWLHRMLQRRRERAYAEILAGGNA